MEVYAAMITRMDKGIGKIVRKLADEEMLENTLIFFLQDNGACTEELRWMKADASADPSQYQVVYQPIPDEALQHTARPKSNRKGFPLASQDLEVPAGAYRR